MRCWRQTKEIGVSAFVVGVRLGLGCLFLYSSLPKIRQPYDFLSAVYGYELVGPQMGLLVAMVLPWAELLTGVCLLGGVFVPGALLASAGMSALFTVVIGWALYQGLQISCGCFGAEASRITLLTLMRAVGVLLLSLLGYLGALHTGPGTEPRSATPATAMENTVCPSHR